MAKFYKYDVAVNLYRVTEILNCFKAHRFQKFIIFYWILNLTTCAHCVLMYSYLQMDFLKECIRMKLFRKTFTSIY